MKKAILALVLVAGVASAQDVFNEFAFSNGKFGSIAVHKFGHANDFDTGDGEVTVWDGADDTLFGASSNMVYTYSTSNDISSISSSSTSDTNQTIVIQGLDANSNLVSQTATLNGTNEVTLTTSLYRVFRAYNSSGTALVGTVYIYSTTALTAGVPTNKSKIRAAIFIGSEQTEMAIYTVPAGYTAFVRGVYGATAGASRSAEYILRLYKRDPGGVFRLQNRVSISDAGSNYIYQPFPSPLVYASGTDIELTVEIPTSNITAASVSGGFDLVLLKNTSY